VMARVQRGTQPRLGLGGLHEQETRRRGVGLGRAPLEQLVELAQGGIVDLATEGVVGAGTAEQLVQGGIVQGRGHAGFLSNRWKEGCTVAAMGMIWSQV